jgi:copper homeostasis protein
MILEVCASSVQSAINAEKGGASRVELCAGINEGGTTPSFGDINLARKHLNIPIHVLIRPRGGDFLYSSLEIDIIKQDIITCKNLGIDGVVFGMLHQDGSVDKVMNKELVNLAWPMKTTFHRAFDMTSDPFKALEDIIELGF